MDHILVSSTLAPGFRFHPADEELFMYYLKRKLMGKPFHHQMMADVDVYKFAPWDLPSLSCLQTRDLNWYFFYRRAMKYYNTSRANRATDFGYWKSTGSDRTINYKNRPIGKIKTLIFHRGKAPKGERTNWVMHEYRIEDRALADNGVSQDVYVIYKIYEKSGLGPKNGEHYGAPFKEEEWESDGDDDSMVTDDNGPTNNPNNDNDSQVENQNALPISSSLNAFPATLSPSINGQPIAIRAEPRATIKSQTDDVELDRMLDMFLADGDAPVVEKEKRLDDNFFERLEDLLPNDSSGFCAGVGLDSDWSQLLLGTDNADNYIQLDDFF